MTVPLRGVTRMTLFEGVTGADTFCDRGEAMKPSSISRGDESTMAGEKKETRPTSGQSRLYGGGNARLGLTALGLREDEGHCGGRILAWLRRGRERAAKDLGGTLAVEGETSSLALASSIRWISEESWATVIWLGERGSL